MGTYHTCPHCKRRAMSKKNQKYLCELCWLAERVTRWRDDGSPITLTRIQADRLKNHIDSRTRLEPEED